MAVPWIESASEYDFVTFEGDGEEGGITIDGNIMPARDVADDGSWKHLRAVDPAFIHEAVMEIRTIYEGITSSAETKVTKLQLSKKIKGTYYQDSLNVLGDGMSWSFFKSINTPFSSCQIIQSGAADDTRGIICEHLEKSHELTSSIQDFVSSSGDNMPLVADAVRKCFYDIQDVRYLLVYWETLTGEMTAWSKAQKKAPDQYSEYDVTTNSSTIKAWISNKWTSTRGGTTKNYGGSCVATASGGEFTFTLKGCKKYVDTSKSVMLVNLLYRGEDTEKHGLAKCSFTATTSGDDITIGVSAANLVTAADSFISAGGITVYDYDNNPGSYKSGYIYAFGSTSFYMVLARGDHTDFSALNWTWTPTS